MSRRPLNIWRIHSDLFTNMAGLILTGGLGMMVLFGGAMLRRTPSDDPYPSTCSRLKHIDGALRRAGFEVTATGCELTAESDGLAYDFGYSMPRRDPAPGTSRVGFDELNALAFPICRSAIFAARIVHDRGRVFIEGHASDDVSDGVLDKELPDRRCVEVAYQRMRLSGKDESIINLQNSDYRSTVREVCNRQISFERAMNIFYTCEAQLHKGLFDRGLKELDDLLESSVDRTTLMRNIQISSQSTGTPAGDSCVESSDGVAGDCGRRVSIRVTMSPALGRP